MLGLSPRPRADRIAWPRLAWPAALALLLHAGLLGGAAAVVGGSEPSRPVVATLRVRQVEATPRPETLPAAPTPTGAATTAHDADDEDNTAAASPVTRADEPRHEQAAAERALAETLARTRPIHATANSTSLEGTPGARDPSTAPNRPSAEAAEPMPTPVAPRTGLAAAPPAAVVTPVATPPADPHLAAVDSALVKPVAGATTAEAELSVPVYRTRPAPAATLQYELRRGFLSGRGELAWRPESDRYEARLEGSVAGMSVITQVSSGALDANGLAPVRFTDQRLRRAPNAANFQRDKRKITYSGPQVEFPLVTGAQDRLSWMLQIGAVLNAEPQRAAAGGHITFFVTGARGDADVWTFRYIGTDELRSDDGPVRAVKFTREPRRPYDSLVEIWLAPERHHLPVRARLTADGSNEVFELLLRDMRFQ